MNHIDFQLAITDCMSPSVPEIFITKPDKRVGRLRKIMVLNPQMIPWTTDNYAKNLKTEK